MNKVLVVTAMDKEACPALYAACNADYLQTGIGTRNTAIAITRRLLSEPKITHILNIGYVGSKLPLTVGEPCIVGNVAYRDYDVSIHNQTFKKSLDVPHSVDFLRVVNCYTADAFYTGGEFLSSDDLPKDLAPVFDMELAAIAQCVNEINPAIKLISIKIVSDLSDIDQYNKVDVDDLTTTLNDLASRVIDEISRN